MYFFLKQKLFSPLSFFMDIIETSLSLSPLSLQRRREGLKPLGWLSGMRGGGEGGKGRDFLCCVRWRRFWKLSNPFSTDTWKQGEGRRGDGSSLTWKENKNERKRQFWDMKRTLSVSPPLPKKSGEQSREKKTRRELQKLIVLGSGTSQVCLS